MSLKPNSANSTNCRPNVLQSQSHSNVIELESEEGKFEQTAQRRLRSPSVSSTKSLVKLEIVEEVGCLLEVVRARPLPPCHTPTTRDAKHTLM